MRITELFENSDNDIRNSELVKIGNSSITAGDVADALEISPNDALRYGGQIVDFFSKEILPNYSRGEAAIDAATVIPLLRASKFALAPIIGKKGATKELGKAGAKQSAKGMVSKGSAFGKVDPNRDDVIPTKKRRYSIGDSINVNYQGMNVKGVINAIVPGGYTVKLPNGDSMSIPEPISEDDASGGATTGSTSSANIAVGVVYPNKSGKTKKNKDGTAKNALDIKDVNLLTGGSLVKRKQ